MTEGCSLRSTLLYAVALAALAWPALWNGQYLWFYDSLAYLSGASRAVESVAGIEGELGWTLNSTDCSSAPLPDDGGQSTPAQATTAATSPDAADDKIIQGGRSVYYGIFLYAGSLAGSLWISVLAQCLAVILTVRVSLAPLFRDSPFSIPLIVTVLGLVTGASFFSVYLMPDIFSGLGTLAAAGLVAFWTLYRGWERLFLAAIILAACLFHTSHVALMLMILLTALALGWMRGTPALGRSTGLIAVALVAGLLGAMAFPVVAKIYLNRETANPPFVVARVIADGPGYRYLKDSCPASGYVLCRYLDRLPTDSDSFLWSVDPETGVYKFMSSDDRAALRREQLGFLWGTLMHAPIDQARISIGNFLQQLTSFRMTDFRYTPGLVQTLQACLPDPVADRARSSQLGQGRFDLEGVSLLQIGIVVLSVVALSATLVVPSLRRSLLDVHSGLPVFAMLVISGVVWNAAITGILSTPHDRYEARIMWLLPLLAATVGALLLSGKRGNGTR